MRLLYCFTGSASDRNSGHSPRPSCLGGLKVSRPSEELRARDPERTAAAQSEWPALLAKRPVCFELVASSASNDIQRGVHPGAVDTRRSSSVPTTVHVDASQSDSSDGSAREPRTSEFGSRPELQALVSRTALLRESCSSRQGQVMGQRELYEADFFAGSNDIATTSGFGHCFQPSVAGQSLRRATLSELLDSTSAANWIGQGAQGAVVRATWSAGCTVAVKWLVVDAVNVPTAYLEALLAKTLAHPHLVQGFDCAICRVDDALGLDNAANPPCGFPTSSLKPSRTSSTDPTADPLSVAPSADSFEGRQSLPADRLSRQTGGPKPVDSLEVLKRLGAGPGKYVVQIVSEWCDGGTLHAAIRRGVFRPYGTRSATWALRALLRTAREVAQALCYLHSQDIIHGDLKPANVLLRSSRQDARGFSAKVADFGLSRLLLASGAQPPKQQQPPSPAAAADAAAPAAAAAQEGRFVSTGEWGTVAYMAGEYLDGRLCKGSDVYSFGVMLWQMYTGRAPFAEHRELQVATGVLTGELQLQWPPATPPPLLRLGQACCHRQPTDRPTFKEIVVALSGMETQVRDIAVAAKTRRQTAAAAAAAAAVASSGSYGVPSVYHGFSSCGVGGCSGVGGGDRCMLVPNNSPVPGPYSYQRYLPDATPAAAAEPAAAAAAAFEAPGAWSSATVAAETACAATSWLASMPGPGQAPALAAGSSCTFGAFTYLLPPVVPLHAVTSAASAASPYPIAAAAAAAASATVPPPLPPLSDDAPGAVVTSMAPTVVAEVRQQPYTCTAADAGAAISTVSGATAASTPLETTASTAAANAMTFALLPYQEELPPPLSYSYAADSAATAATAVFAAAAQPRGPATPSPLPENRAAPAAAVESPGDKAGRGFTAATSAGGLASCQSYSRDRAARHPHPHPRPPVHAPPHSYHHNARFAGAFQQPLKRSGSMPSRTGAVHAAPMASDGSGTARPADFVSGRSGGSSSNYCVDGSISTRSGSSSGLCAVSSATPGAESGDMLAHSHVWIPFNQAPYLLPTSAAPTVNGMPIRRTRSSFSTSSSSCSGSGSGGRDSTRMYGSFNSSSSYNLSYSWRRASRRSSGLSLMQHVPEDEDDAGAAAGSAADSVCSAAGAGAGAGADSAIGATSGAISGAADNTGSSCGRGGNGACSGSGSGGNVTEAHARPHPSAVLSHAVTHDCCYVPV